MPRHYRYISADSHLEIDSKHWLDRVPEKYLDLAPRLVRQSDGSDAWLIGDKIKRPAAAADLYGGKGRDNYVPFNGRYEGTPGTGSAEQRLREQNQRRHRRRSALPIPARRPKVLASHREQRRLQSHRARLQQLAGGRILRRRSRSVDRRRHIARSDARSPTSSTN